jgi:hypothetical protein
MGRTVAHAMPLITRPSLLDSARSSRIFREADRTEQAYGYRNRPEQTTFPPQFDWHGLRNPHSRPLEWTNFMLGSEMRTGQQNRQNGGRGQRLKRRLRSVIAAVVAAGPSVIYDFRGQEGAWGSEMVWSE